MPYKTPSTPPDNSMICRRLYFPNTPEFTDIVNGAVSTIIYESSFTEFGDLSPADTAQYFKQMWVRFINETCMLGTVFPYLTTNPPDGCLPCDGTEYLREDYPDLYELLDVTFIVDGDTFVTPDLQGRTVIGAGTGAGLTSRLLGQSLGAEQHQLTEGELALHAHTYVPPVINIDLEDIGAPDPAAAGIGFPTSTGNAGGDQPHNNMQPSYVLAYCMVAR